MTLMRWSLVCALLALSFLILSMCVGSSKPSTLSLGYYFFMFCSVALGTLGAFVFRKY